MKKTVLLICTLALSTILAAQPRREKFNPEEFKAKLENFITTKAGFTSAEAQAFYPTYHEMKDKQRKLQREIFQLKKDAPNNNASDKDFTLVIQKITDLEVEMASIKVTYYKKMCENVSPRKVYAAMQAEDKFHREMLEGFRRDTPRPKGHEQKTDK